MSMHVSLKNSESLVDVTRSFSSELVNHLRAIPIRDPF